MSWTWYWGLFAVALVICTVLVMFSRGAMNRANVEKYGARADYRAEPGMAIFGSIVAGAVYAAVLTAVAGFLF